MEYINFSNIYYFCYTSYLAGPAGASVEQEDSFGDSRGAVEMIEDIPLVSHNMDTPEDTTLGSPHYQPTETPSMN